MPAAYIDPEEEIRGDRDRSAAYEEMAVEQVGDDWFDVTKPDGTTYEVDLREGRCTCPDHQHRRAHCKHLRRVEFFVGMRGIPAALDVEELADSLREAVREQAEA